jgi:hypothetical protein
VSQTRLCWLPLAAALLLPGPPVQGDDQLPPEGVKVLSLTE